MLGKENLFTCKTSKAEHLLLFHAPLCSYSAVIHNDGAYGHYPSLTQRRFPLVAFFTALAQQ